MNIAVRKTRDIQILDCSGQITLGAGTMNIRNTVRELVQSGERKDRKHKLPAGHALALRPLRQLPIKLPYVNRGAKNYPLDRIRGHPNLK